MKILLHSHVLQTAGIAVLVLGMGPIGANAQSNPQDASGQSGPQSRIETITVTGTRLQAQEAKKEAPNVKEVQPYTEMRKLPDVNVAEALQRIPGISLEADTGEGRFINIRGMDADLNGTTFDGVVLTASNQASPQGGGRAVAFDVFPSQLIGGIEVIKSLTPDMDASGLGGVINLLSRTPSADGSPFLDASVGSGLEALRDRPIWQTDITGGTSFDLPGHVGSDRFTFVATYAFYEDWRGIDDLEEGYQNDPFVGDPSVDKQLNNLQYRWYEYHRTRQGTGAFLSFSPDANNTFYVRAIYSGYMEHANKHHLELQNLGDLNTNTGVSEPDANGNYSAWATQPVQTLTDSDENVHNALLVVGGHSIFGALKTDYRLSWTRGMDDFPKNWGAVFALPNSDVGADSPINNPPTTNAVPMTYNNITSAAFPTYNSPINLADPSNYTLGPGNSNSQLLNTPSKSFEQEWAAAIDFTLPLDLGGEDGMLKFGSMVRLRQLGVSQNQMTFSTPSDVSLAGLTNGPDQVYYDNHYNIGAALNAAAIETLPGLYLSDPAGDLQSDLSSFEHDDENVYAGYVQYSADFGPLGFLTGVRYEVTNGAYHANLQSTDTSGNVTFTPNTNKQDYANFFPSLQTKYTLDDETQFRAAFSTAIARPGFNQITAAKSIDLSNYPNVAISEGNPSLKPETGDSFDLVAEHYMPDGGLATLNGFYKYFSNYIIPTTDTVNNSNGGQTVTSSYNDIGHAFAEGVELDYSQKLIFLPEPLDGFGVDGNLTYVHSRGEIRAGERKALPQTSPFNYNAELFYEKGPISVRLGAGYVSANIFAVGSDWSQDVYSQPRFRLDLGSTFDLTDNIQLYFNAKNLTNTLLEFTQTDNKYGADVDKGGIYGV